MQNARGRAGGHHVTQTHMYTYTRAEPRTSNAHTHMRMPHAISTTLQARSTRKTEGGGACRAAARTHSVAPSTQEHHSPPPASPACAARRCPPLCTSVRPLTLRAQLHSSPCLPQADGGAVAPPAAAAVGMLLLLLLLLPLLLLLAARDGLLRLFLLAGAASASRSRRHF